MSSLYTLYLDLGASLTKGFFVSPSGQLEPLLMGSEVSGLLDRTHLDAVKAFNTTSTPEVCAWVHRGDEIRAVGLFAQNFGGESWVDERKELKAVHKVLAAIGVMKERGIAISGTGFAQVPMTVRLGMLLPFSEFEDRQLIMKELRSVKEFTFRGQPIKLDMKEITFRPEGFGLCLDAIKTLRSRGINPDHRKILVVMAGHRNTSVLLFEGGSFQSGKSTSTGPGFVEALTKGLQSGAFQKSDQPKLLKALVGGSSNVVLKGDKKPTDISNSVKVGRDAYWSLLESFLTAHLTAHMDEHTFIMVSGGASQLIKPQMSAYLEGFGLDPSSFQIGYQISAHDLQVLSTPISGTYQQLDDRLSESLRHLVADPRTDLEAMAARMVDAYVAINQMMATTKPLASATPPNGKMSSPISA